MDSTSLIGWAIISLCIISVVILLTVGNVGVHQCEAKGGTYMNTGAGYRCLKIEVLE